MNSVSSFTKSNSIISAIAWVIFFTMNACTSSDAYKEPSLDIIKVMTTDVQNISEHITILVSGFLEADRTVPVSFLVPGKVERVYFDEGDHVKKGQILEDNSNGWEIIKQKV